MRRPHFVRLVLGLLAIGHATDASAWVQSISDKSGAVLRWDGTNCIAVRVNTTGSDDVTDGSDLKAVERAVVNWTSATGSCTYMRLRLRPPSPDAKFGFTQKEANETAVIWVEKGWQRDAFHDTAAAGLTTVFFVDSPGSPRDGVIIDADVELNGEFFTYTTSGDATKTDIENTVTHELGHVLGLDHPCFIGRPKRVPKNDKGKAIGTCTDTATTAMRETTMYPDARPGETKKRTPDADDVAGVCAIYPIGEDPLCCRFEGCPCGCAMTPRPSPDAPAPGAPLVIVSLVALATIRIATVYRSRPNAGR